MKERTCGALDIILLGAHFMFKTRYPYYSLHISLNQSVHGNYISPCFKLPLACEQALVRRGGRGGRGGGGRGKRIRNT